MKKLTLTLLFSLLIMTGCGHTPVDMSRIEADVLSRSGGSNLEFIDEVAIVENDNMTVDYTNTISHNSKKLTTYEHIKLHYIFNKEEREWIVDSYITKLDHYEPLVGAHEAQPALTNELGFGEELTIYNQIISIDDPYISINQVDATFDGTNYSDYLYEITYDNGAVSATATYKISYEFVRNRGEWHFVQNKLIEDFSPITSLKLDNAKSFNEMFIEYFVVKQKGTLSLVGDDSNIKHGLSLTDETLSINVLSEINLESLDTASVDIQLLKEDDSFDIDVKLRVFLLLDEMKQTWQIIEVKPLVNQTSITLSNKFLGTWEGYYRLRGDEYKATLLINSFINNGAYFEGVVSFESSDTFKVEDGSFTVIGGFSNGELIIELSEWLVQPHRIKAHSMFIDDLTFSDGNHKLIGHMTWQSDDDYKVMFIKN